MGFKKPTVSKIVSDIKNLTIYLRTQKKFGKSTLFRDVVLEKYGDAQRGLLVGVGAEMGYTLLDNLNHTHIETWEELTGLKDWLIEEKGNEHNIELVAFDVVDELLPIIEQEVVRQSIIDTKKPCKSIKAAYGGYNAGVEMVVQMAKDYFLDLKKAGIGVWCIAHTKFKNVKQKGDIDEGYMSLSSTLNSNYESIFGDVFDCVLTGYIDRALEEETITMPDEKEKKIRHATDEIRKLYLRGNTFIDAGCRFKDGSVPEYIVFDKPNMAKDFISVLEEGMRLSKSEVVSKEEFKEIQKADAIEEKNKIREVPAKTELQSDDIVDEDKNKELIKDISGKYKNATADQKSNVKEILESYGSKKLDPALPTKAFEEILKIFA
jgi:hypothetical protein